MDSNILYYCVQDYSLNRFDLVEIYDNFVCPQSIYLCECVNFELLYQIQFMI